LRKWSEWSDWKPLGEQVTVTSGDTVVIVSEVKFEDVMLHPGDVLAVEHRITYL
jgi:hypothetical protein